MLKKCIVLLLMIQPMFAWAEFENNEDKESILQVTMSPVDAVKIAGNLVYEGKYDKALQILTMMPQTSIPSVEIERWYLIAQIEQRSGNIKEAIRIYRKLLDEQPDLVKIRYELALCYMVEQQWYRADYHLRLAMAGQDIPDGVKQQMMYYRYIARQNKNWNVWFNVGAAPDTNVNQATGGKECVINEWGEFCRYLPEPERVIGTNLSLGGCTIYSERFIYININIFTIRNSYCMSSIYKTCIYINSFIRHYKCANITIILTNC